MFKKLCTKIYIKKCLAKSYKYHQAHLWITWEFHLANISDWNLKPCCGFRRRGEWPETCLFIYFSPLLISETSELVQPPWHTQASEAITETKFLGASSPIESCIGFRKDCLSWEGGDMISYPQERASPFWRRPEKDLTEGLLRRRGGQREEGAAGWEPQPSPSSG